MWHHLGEAARLAPRLAVFGLALGLAAVRALGAALRPSPGRRATPPSARARGRVGRWQSGLDATRARTPDEAADRQPGA